MQRKGEVKNFTFSFYIYFLFQQLHRQNNLIYISQLACCNVVIAHFFAIYDKTLVTALCAIRILHNDMKLLSTEVLVDLEFLPVRRNRWCDTKPIEVRTHTKDTLNQCTCALPSNGLSELSVNCPWQYGSSFLISALSFMDAGELSVKYSNARFPCPIRDSARIIQPCGCEKIPPFSFVDGLNRSINAPSNA